MPCVLAPSVGALLFWLTVGHALGDYAFQTDFVARTKCRGHGVAGMPFLFPLLAHALIHGAAVALCTGSVPLGLAETAAHAAIDHGKAGRRFGTSTDQLLHLACKLLWAGLWRAGVR